VALGRGVDREVAAHADVAAGVPLRAALADDDVAWMTSSPPYFFTPSRLPAESRPLRELPPAFLCAMT
jgi:hypothetical protein